MQLSALHVFKTPQITSMAEFLSSEAGANDVSMPMPMPRFPNGPYKYTSNHKAKFILVLFDHAEF